MIRWRRLGVAEVDCLHWRAICVGGIHQQRMGCRKWRRSGSPLNVICIESRISRVHLREVHVLKCGPTSGVTIATGHFGVGDLRQLGMRGVDCQRRAQDELVGVASRVGARCEPVYGVVVKRDGLGHKRGVEAALAFRDPTSRSIEQSVRAWRGETVCLQRHG